MEVLGKGQIEPYVATDVEVVVQNASISGRPSTSSLAVSLNLPPHPVYSSELWWLP